MGRYFGDVEEVVCGSCIHTDEMQVSVRQRKDCCKITNIEEYQLFYVQSPKKSTPSFVTDGKQNCLLQFRKHMTTSYK